MTVAQQAAPPLGVEADRVGGGDELVEQLEEAVRVLVVREVPGSGMADTVEVCGAGLATLAAVEVGGPTTLPFTFSRPAAEEVFRTLATERRSDRARNPGLPADEVHHVLGVSCAVVALLRGLALQAITVTEA